MKKNIPVIALLLIAIIFQLRGMYARPTLGDLLPENVDASAITAVRYEDLTTPVPMSVVNDHIIEITETLGYIRVKPIDHEIDGHLSEGYFIISIGDEKLILFDDDTVMVSKDGVFTKYMLVDHSYNLYDHLKWEG